MKEKNILLSRLRINLVAEGLLDPAMIACLPIGHMVQILLAC